MNKDSEDSQLELQVASLLWPNRNIHWNAEGHWYVEHDLWPINVPRWSSNNEDCLKLMMRLRKFPMYAYEGVCYTCCGRILLETFAAHDGDEMKALRIATLKAAICFLSK